MKRLSLSIIGLAIAASAFAQEPSKAPERPALQRFIIERDVPGAGKWTLADMREGALKSNAVLRDMGSDIQWVHSYVAGDKVYCVYNATSEALIRRHAERSGFPANRITPVAAVLDPTTAR